MTLAVTLTLTEADLPTDLRDKLQKIAIGKLMGDVVESDVPTYAHWDAATEDYVNRYGSHDIAIYSTIVNQAIGRFSAVVKPRSTEGPRKRPYLRIYAPGIQKVGSAAYLLLKPGVLHLRLPAHRATNYTANTIHRGRYQVELDVRTADIETIMSAIGEAIERAKNGELWDWE